MDQLWKERVLNALEKEPLSRIELSAKIFLNMNDVDKVIVQLFNEGRVLPVEGRWRIYRKKH